MFECQLGITIEQWRVKLQFASFSFFSNNQDLNLNHQRGGEAPAAVRRRIFDIIYDIFGTPVWFVFTSGKPSGARSPILEGLLDISASHESSEQVFRRPVLE